MTMSRAILIALFSSKSSLMPRKHGFAAAVICLVFSVDMHYRRALPHSQAFSPDRNVVILSF
jgi:hypothetical protein